MASASLHKGTLRATATRVGILRRIGPVHRVGRLMHADVYTRLLSQAKDERRGCTNTNIDPADEKVKKRRGQHFGHRKFRIRGRH